MNDPASPEPRDPIESSPAAGDDIAPSTTNDSAELPVVDVPAVTATDVESDIAESDNTGDSAEPANEQSADGGPSDDESLASLASGTLGRRKRRRRRQAVLLLILAIVGASFLVISNGTVKVVQTETLAINPGILLEQMILDAKRDSSLAFQVSDFAVDDMMIEQLRGMEFLETVIIDQGVLTDASMEVFTTLPKLQHLRLRLSPITDKGLLKLSRCETLQILNLPHAECSVEGVKHLKAIPKLRTIRMGAPRMGNEVTRELAELTSLRSVHLIGIPVTNDGLKSLAGIPHLESLYLDDSAVTESGWLWLFEQHPELHVHINQQHHDRDPHIHKHHD